MQTKKLPVAVASTLLMVLAFIVSPVQSAQVQLSWNAPTTNADGTPLTDLASYNLYRCEGAGCIPVLHRNVGNVTTFTDTGLAESTLYRYQVTALDTSVNESDGSNSAEGMPRPAGTCTTEGLIAHWKFDDGAGTTAMDSSGKGRHGRLINMESTDWVAGHLGKALDFDGTNEFVSAGSPSGLDNINTFTYTAWINPYAINTAAENDILSKVASGVGKVFAIGWWGSQGRLALYIDRSALALDVESIDGTIVTGAWQFVAATFNGVSTARLYHGPAEVAYAVQDPGAGAILSEAAGNLRIGAQSSSFGQFDGKIDDFRIYNRVLSLAELQCLAGM